MAIVNPYLKRKKPGAGRNAGALVSTRTPAGTRTSTSIPTPPTRLASGSTTHDPIGTNTAVNVNAHDAARPRNENVHAHIQILGASQAPPTPRVTPNGKQKTTKTQTGKSLGSGSSGGSSRRIGTSATQAFGRAGVSPSITTTAASSSGKTLRPTTRSGKSVKQRLKQEIAALKKQKQLETLRRETEQRLRLRRTERAAQEERRKTELARRTAEQQRKKADRERLRAAKQNEKIRRQREKEQRRLEKEREKERKQEEKRLMAEQKLREQRSRAEAKYQRDLKAWKNHQQRWMEQQQRIHFFQQQQQQQQQQRFWHLHQQQQQKTHAVSHDALQLDPHVLFSPNEDRHPRPVHPKTGSDSPPPPSPQTPLHGAVQTEPDAVPDGTTPKRSQPPTALASASTLDSTPVSPIDSPTALAIDALIDAGDWMSPKRLVEASDDADDGAGSVGVASSSTTTTTTTAETKPMALDNNNQDFDLGAKASDSLSVENPSSPNPPGSLPSSTLEDPNAESSAATACPRNGGTDCPSAGEPLPSPLPSPLSLSLSSSLPPRDNEEPVTQKLERAAPSNAAATTTTKQERQPEHSFPRPPQYVAPNHPVTNTTRYQPNDSRGPMTILPYGLTSITSGSGMLAPRAAVLPPQSWHSATPTATVTATMPVYPTSVVWNAQNYHHCCYGMQHFPSASASASLSSSLAWIPPPPPPPQPPVLWPTSRALVRRPRPRAPRAKKKAEQPVLLCEPLEPPSPFANRHRRDNNRYLLTILVVRDPRTENSFGVNLKLHTESALVDPAWIEAQQKQKQSKSNSNNNNNNSKEQPNPKRDERGTPSATSGTQTKATGAPENECSVGTPVPVRRTVGAQHPSPPSVRLPPKGPTESSGTDPPAENTGTIPSVTSQSKTELAAATIVRGQIATNPKGKTDENGGTSNPASEQPACRSNSKDDEDAANAKSVVKKCLEDLVTSIENGQKGTNKTAGKVPLVQKRKRRRRVNFSVMMVTDAERQNARRPDVDSNEKLRAGDIVVAVQGHDLHGMSFRDACAVFSREADVVSDSLIQTRLVVARKKESVVPLKVETVAKPPPAKATPMPSSGTTAVNLPPPVNSSMVFSPAEIAALSNCFFQMLHSTKRVLGQDIPDTLWQMHTTIFQMGSILKDTALTPRETTTLKNKWMDLARLMDYGMVEKGKSYWTKKFREEFGTESIPFSSDVERHAMRHLPRPSKGCRCKDTDHKYVSDPKCVLYRDLRKRLSTEELAELRRHKKSNYVPDSSKELNAVESAFKSRILKLKTETENESIEARFVDKMEEIQVKELHKAVFAPNLTTIVLSTIFELRREFRISVKEDEEDNNDERSNNNTNEEDDDVPLECLGKRKPDGETEGHTRKQHKLDREGDPKFCMKYLIRMLDFVSKTWGHCYREPDTDEYAWRWELFHAVHSDHDHWEAHATNPRTTGSFPFENVRFGLKGSRSISNELSTFSKSVREFEDSVLSDSPSTLSISNEILDQFCLAVHVLSPTRSGLYDELIALLKMGIIKVSTSGIPVLTDDWWTKVDIVVLDDMITSWSTKTDPDSRHCVNEELRDTLEEQWVKSDNGWSLMENPKELIFDFAILDEWRETFEGRLEEKADISEGIGLFGL